MGEESLHPRKGSRACGSQGRIGGTGWMGRKTLLPSHPAYPAFPAYPALPAYRAFPAYPALPAYRALLGQNVMRVTSCSARAGATPLIVPNPFGCVSTPCALYGRLVIVRSVKLAKFTVLLISVNWFVFNALKMSIRNSNFMLRTIAKFFEIDRSTLLSGGSRAKYRGVSSPLLPGCGGARHDGLSNCRYGSPLQPFPGSQVRATRAFGTFVPVRFAAPMPGIEKLIVYGRPLVQR